ncbi:hypothetical protein K456DRAFT_91164 [Colletotrichum gloeosporioides 23]|nr:hypothetical protein K456DRAFT_91164 [Colletotrichum gloeosporioides 23]
MPSIVSLKLFISKALLPFARCCIFGSLSMSACKVTQSSSVKLRSYLSWVTSCPALANVSSKSFVILQSSNTEVSEMGSTWRCGRSGIDTRRSLLSPLILPAVSWPMEGCMSQADMRAPGRPSEIRAM